MLKVAMVVVLIGLTIFALIDLFNVPADQVRGGSRFLWALGILLVPLVGPVLWLWLGRAPEETGMGPLPPDDDPDFLRGMNPH